jgi:hypothetical protein
MFAQSLGSIEPVVWPPIKDGQTDGQTETVLEKYNIDNSNCISLGHLPTRYRKSTPSKHHAEVANPCQPILM